MTSQTKNNNSFISWQIICLALALFCGGVGFAATSVLLKVPSQANCSKLSLLFGSATNRFACAELEAEKNTVDGLLKAISLLSELPEDHPLKEQINGYISQWLEQILVLAENQINQGNLAEAIAITKRIPASLANKELIAEKVSQWENTWATGEEVTALIESQLREAQWNTAFLTAVRFLDLDSTYWQQTKYDEIVATITGAREESKQLDEAYSALQQGGISNLVKTVEIALKMPNSSYSYEQAQELITEAEGQINDLVTQFVDNRNWSDLETLARQIPDKSGLKLKAREWQTLASAGRNADLGTFSSLDLAVAQVDKISSDSELFDLSRELQQTWQQEKENLIYLTQARDLAKAGDVGDLRRAITRAEFITTENPLYGEAQKEIRKWNQEIEVIEDQPTLNRAKEIAQQNTVSAWAKAIEVASAIPQNRALHSESRSLINQWRGNIQRVEDQPILNQAIALGNNNNYNQAIEVANRIGRGRALHSEAQSRIRTWRREISAEENLQQAYEVAQNRDPQSLARAINIARGIPSSTRVGSQSRTAVNLWSEQLLSLARRSASRYTREAISNAIEIADLIPSGSSAYNQARQDMESWRRAMTPSSPSVNPYNNTPPEFPAEPTLEDANFY
ncbi:MAG: hypothetical protein IGQ45_06150 [Cyanobacterium sp. T60_A2020_053]|nr:hypothetical protein [Cyanobacterium sp. T60_A2020_053]